jgi:hypothetical protein
MLLISVLSLFGINGIYSYQVGPQKLNYGEAQTYCEDNFGSSLATITSATEQANATIACFDQANEGCWFGLNDQAGEGTFTFVDGTPFTADSYTNWYEGEPNNSGNEDCVEVSFGFDGKWNDVRCGAALYPLCNDGLPTGCSAVDIDGFLVGCSTQFALTNSNVAGNEATITANYGLIADNDQKISDNDVRISDNYDAIQENTDLINDKSTEYDAEFLRFLGLISDNDDDIQANTDLINNKSTEYYAEFQYIEERFAAIATFEAAHAGPAVVDGFGNNTSLSNSNNLFLLMSLLANVFLVLSSCYMVNKSRKGGYNKVKMYSETEVDTPFK